MKKETAGIHAALVEKACRLIGESDSAPALEALAKAVGMSPFHFHRVFRAATGLTVKAYAKAHRAGRVRKALETSPTVTDAAYAAGYATGGRFYADADAALGMTPKIFRKGGTGERVRFAVAKCSLGALLVAATAKGVCAIALGDAPDALVRELQDRFLHAEPVGADEDFERLVARVAGLVENPERDAALPLDIRGTAFQHRVWDALRKIPAGRTMTYAEVAEAIGSPRSVRAVAGACAANTLAIAVPCHRVVRTDGSLSGYRWGVPRKRELLIRESRA